MSIDFAITGDRVAGIKFEQFPEQARLAIHQRMLSIVLRLEAAILAVTPMHTGKLRSEIQYFVDDRPNGVVGKVKVVAPNAAAILAAAALEYGAHGPVSVSTHSRGVTTVFGRHVAPIDAIVTAYSRTADVTEARFLRGPFQALQAEFVAELQATIDAAAVAANRA